MTGWRCGWTERTGRCLRYDCRKSGPCEGFDDGNQTITNLPEYSRKRKRAEALKKERLILIGTMRAILEAEGFTEEQATEWFGAAIKDAIRKDEA